MVVVRVRSPVRLICTRTVPFVSPIRGLDSKNTAVVVCSFAWATRATCSICSAAAGLIIGGSPLIVVEAVDLAVAVREPSSRRVTPNTAHATDPASGDSPSLPLPGADSRSLPRPTTASRAGAAVIAGAAATAATVDTITDSATEGGCGDANHADAGSAGEGKVSISAAGGV